MSLVPVTRLGVNDITAQIGEGGPAFARALRELQRRSRWSPEQATMIGKSLGPYPVVATLGEGGMGEVRAGIALGWATR